MNLKWILFLLTIGVLLLKQSSKVMAYDHHFLLGSKTFNRIKKSLRTYKKKKRPKLIIKENFSTTLIPNSKVTHPPTLKHYNPNNLKENFSPIELGKDLSFINSNNNTQSYDLEYIQEQILTQGFESRKFIEDLYQVKQDVFARLSKILPGINASFASGNIPSTLLGVTTGLLGVLIPGNWFDWNESKFFFESQKKSFQQLLSIKALEAENIFYNLHRLKIEYEIYNYYLQRLENLISYLNQDRKYSNIKIIILALQNLYYSFENKKIAINYAIQASIPEIQFLMGLKEFSSLVDLTPVKLPSKLTPNFDQLDRNLIYKRALDLSSLKLLKVGAEFSKRSRIFNFVNANETGGAVSFVFDLSYFPNVQKKKSEIRKIQVCIDETKSNINKTMELIKIKQQVSIDLYERAKKWKKENHDVADLFISAITGHDQVDMMMTIDILEWAISFEIAKNFAQHLYLISQSELHFLIKNKKIYQKIEDLLPRQRPIQFIKNPKRYIENKRMEKAILKGRIKRYLYDEN